MKKYLFLIAICLISTNAYSENITDIIGAECGKIVYSLNNFEYPKNYKIINSRNKQFVSLEKCLNIYKENGGNIDVLNKRYFRAKKGYILDLSVCYSIKDKKKIEDCKAFADMMFFDNLLRDIPNPSIATVNDADTFEKYNNFTKECKKADELLLEAEKNNQAKINNQNKEKQGFFKRLFH